MMQDLLRADAAAADNHGDDDNDNDAEDFADYDDDADDGADNDDDGQGAGDLQAAEASPGHRAAAPRRARGNLLQIQVTTSPLLEEFASIAVLAINIWYQGILIKLQNCACLWIQFVKWETFDAM